MSSFFRITLLGLFAASGVGLAVCLAMSSVPADHQAATSSTNMPLSGRAPMPVRLSGVPPIDPVILPAQGPVTQQAPSGAEQADFLRKVLGAINSLERTPPPGPAPVPNGEPPAPIEVAPPTPSPTPAQADKGAKPEPKARIARPTGEGDHGLSITIQGADIREVLELLSEQGNLNILATNSVQGNVSASLKQVDIETALDAILKSTGFVWRRDGQFIYVGTPKDFDTMQQARDRIATRLYRPNYVKASELQVLVTPLLTAGVGMISAGTAADAGIAPNGNEVGGDAFAGQETLVVRDYEAVLLQIDQIVDQVDRRPTQVAIEAMILSVKLDDNNAFGVDFEALRNQGTVRITSGSPLTSLAGLNVNDKGLKIGFLDSSLSLLVNALETIGDTNVIATPRLMCLNKQRAEILIGEQLGYVSTTQTETSTTQSVEFLEVGTQLRIRPFISNDGLVRMEVHPELSTGNVRIEGGFTLPDKEVTQVTTNIMVRDGCTVIIGGLLRNELISNVTQIPFFGSLPVVGVAFRQTDQSTERREILVLITPRIVYEPGTCCQGDHAAAEFHHRHNNYADQMNPLGKRYLGRKYFRLAQDAWAAADQQRALRLVNLAIHFDPLSRAALDLRADIWAGNPVGDHTLNGEAVAPWLLERLAEPHIDAAPLHPLDAGRPGEQHKIMPPALPQ